MGTFSPCISYNFFVGFWHFEFGIFFSRKRAQKSRDDLKQQKHEALIWSISLGVLSQCGSTRHKYLTYSHFGKKGREKAQKIGEEYKYGGQ